MIYAIKKCSKVIFWSQGMGKWFTDTGKKQTDTNIETSYHGQPYRTIEINLEEQMRFV